MKIYLVGNFAQLSNKEREHHMKDLIVSKDRPYRRMISFYYDKHLETALSLKEEEEKG